MSWSELKRLVGDAESNDEVRQRLRGSRSEAQLLLSARRQGYHITRRDLWRAWREHQATNAGRVSGG